MKAWRKKARTAAVMGSCPKSRASFVSGLRHWIKYIETVHPACNVDCVCFPPLLEDVLGWSNTFRYAVISCSVLSMPPVATCQVLPHLLQLPWLSQRCMPRIRLRGTASWASGVEEGYGCHPQEAVLCTTPQDVYPQVALAQQCCVCAAECIASALSRHILFNMVCAVAKEMEELKFAMLWLLSYLFLLRVPSEALPTCKARPDSEGAELMQSLIWRDGDLICFRCAFVRVRHSVCVCAPPFSLHLPSQDEDA